MYRCKEIVILNRRVAIAVYRTREGINVLIEGGDKGHIGAVAVARGGEIVESVCFPGHREDIVCESWAKEISGLVPGPAVVEAGIHYDGITKGQIEEVMEVLTAQRKELMEELRRNQERDLKKRKELMEKLAEESGRDLEKRKELMEELRRNQEQGLK